MRHSYYVKQREPHFSAGSLLLEDVFINRDDTFKGGGDVTHLAVHGGCCSAGKKRAHSSHFVHPKKTYLCLLHTLHYSWTSALLLLLLCKGFNRTRMRRLNSKVTFASEVSLRTLVRMELEVISAFFLSFFFSLKNQITHPSTKDTHTSFGLSIIQNEQRSTLPPCCTCCHFTRNEHWPVEKAVLLILITYPCVRQWSFLTRLLFVDIRLYFFYLTSHLCSSSRLKVSQS